MLNQVTLSHWKTALAAVPGTTKRVLAGKLLDISSGNPIYQEAARPVSTVFSVGMRQISPLRMLLHVKPVPASYLDGVLSRQGLSLCGMSPTLVTNHQPVASIPLCEGSREFCSVSIKNGSTDELQSFSERGGETGVLTKI